MKQELTLENVKQSIQCMIDKDDIGGLEDFMVYQEEVTNARNRLIDDFTNDFELQIRGDSEDGYIAVVTADNIVGKSGKSYRIEYVLDYEFDFYIEYDPDKKEEEQTIYKAIQNKLFYYSVLYEVYKKDCI